MKILFTMTTLALFSVHFALAVEGVRVYDYQNQWTSDNALLAEGVFSGSGIPNNLDDRISSIRVFPGWKVTISENANGTGFTKTYVAGGQMLDLNLPVELHNKASYFAVRPVSGARIYDYQNQWVSDDALLHVGTYSGASIPNNLNNRASSIKVLPGWKLIVAANADGSGFSQAWEARNTVLNANLPGDLNDQASYFKVEPLNAVRIYDYKNQWASDDAILAAGTYSGAEIPNNLDGRTSSIKVFAGFQVTFAENADGTGYSKTYISRNGALNRNLPDELHNNVSYIRIVPHVDVLKKGVGTKDNTDAIKTNASWMYDWGPKDSTVWQYRYVPMQWGKGNANSPEYINSIDDVSHLLTFNESDDPSGQSGQYGYMYIPDTAVAAYEKMLKTGLRMGSPATREGAVDDYLYDFLTEAQSQGFRVDFVAVHWYDWKAWGNSHNREPNPQDVFNRFKNYLNEVYDMYGLPIWVTEFNANPNRYKWVQREFLELALPWLESQGFIERYAYFQCADMCQFQDSLGNLTDIGEVYRDQVSTLSIPEDYWDGPSILEVTITPSSTNLRQTATTGNGLEKAGIIISPNPVVSALNIEGVAPDEEVEVFNLQGQVLIRARGNHIDVSGLSSGLYLVQVRGKTFRFIK